jgi:signal transduction histidine kinase
MNSLERRLQLGLGISLFVLMFLLWLAGHTSVRGLMEEFVVSRLEHDMESLLSSLVIEPGPSRLRWRRINPIYSQPFSGHYYRVQIDGQTPMVSRSLWDYRLDLPQVKTGEKRRLTLPGPQGQSLLVLVHGYAKQGQSISLAVAEDMTPLHEQETEFRLLFALLALVGLVLLLLVQRLVLRYSFRSLEQVRQQLGQLGEGERQSLTEAVPREILPLVKEFNHLLALLSQRLERSRHALGNLAHALKGPLSLLVGYLESEDSSPQAREDARGHAERIRLLTERELKRARVAGRGGSTQRFDPRAELPDLLRVLKQIYQGKSLDIAWRVDAAVLPFGDREDMLEMVGNLLDNGCKWAAAKVLCHVALDASVIVEIEDDGPGLSPEALRQLSQRGVRLDETVEGHGLGLAIVRDIVTLYEGSLSFDRSQQLGGLRVRVSLPPTAI